MLHQEDKKNKNAKQRRLIGSVVSDRMQKTRVIEIVRLKKHSKYLKYYKVTRRFKAHDENNRYKNGDKVVIEETRPLSKDKRWVIVEKIISGNNEIQQNQ